MATEIEIKLQVPPQARRALHAELARGAAPTQRQMLAARYFDTPARDLARAGIAWRLRREGRRWVQTVKAAGLRSLVREEHDVPCADARADASRHAGTPAGDRLLAELAAAAARGQSPALRFETRVRRTVRVVRSRGATIEVAFDEGTLVANGRRLPVCEIEFECLSGPVAPMLALAARWSTRFGLWLDPRSKAERGDALADGRSCPALRKAEPVAYGRGASPRQAFAAVIDECLDQITRNAAGLVDGDPALRVEHVHQLRVAIRRLRSALRSFRGWVEPPPAALVDGLRGLFARLGRTRDADVTGGPVAAALAAAGAPPLQVPAPVDVEDVAVSVMAPEVQRLLLDWLRWRVALDAAEPAERGAGNVIDFASVAARRLRRWHRGLAAAAAAFEQLDEAGLHELRKRIKRQRYALEFFTPLLGRRAVGRCLRAVAEVQERMGALNDLFVARDRHRALVEHDAAAWFALGWLAARIVDARAAVQPSLQRLRRIDPPRAA